MSTALGLTALLVILAWIGVDLSDRLADSRPTGLGLPEVASPADNEQVPVGPVELKVRPDPGLTGPVNVTFYGREVTGVKRFTLVVLPDTQYYSQSAPATFLAQTKWAALFRDALNIKFVAHVGDVVQHHNREQQWIRADRALAELDQANIPYAVVPGNHDITSGPDNAYYDQYLSPARFAEHRWYLGYLGDSASAPAHGTQSDDVDDAGIDRLNKNSYQVVKVGSLRLVVLGLEYDMPQYSVDWAQRVIDAQTKTHPRTKFILVTHNFIDRSGRRPTSPQRRVDGNSAQDVWESLVQPNCQIRFVISGHYSSEALRQDRNDCGEPVYQILSNYPGRDGGGGWLRYLTFNPGQDHISVNTYSPTLGRFETDEDSSFTLPFRMPETTAFRQIESLDDVDPGQVTSTTWNVRSSGRFQWYATVTGSAQTSRTRTSSFGSTD